MLGRRKRGAKIVIGESDDFPADEVSVEDDALEERLSIFFDEKRAQALARGKASGGGRLLTCVTFPWAW